MKHAMISFAQLHVVLDALELDSQRQRQQGRSKAETCIKQLIDRCTLCAAACLLIGVRCS
mgnify:CR=1 FL=1